ncbi:MAG: hypothetical protein MI861_09625 [Pirellulales bacterium]|nr:hypothetical protein [Pirellulales bacterium]
MKPTISTLLISLLGCVAGSIIGLAGDQQGGELQTPTALDVAHLPNACQLHAKVISGGQPEGEAGFEALRKLGVRTIISVDGAKPNLALAKKAGLRYIHLPHGYDGIPPDRRIELAKAVQEADEPVYIHCHHGMHRSPAAAAVACVGAGMISRQQAMSVLTIAGTSPEYQGLFRVVDQATSVDNLSKIKVDFQESVAVPPLAASMVSLELSFDRMRKIEAARWQPPPQHPDLSPRHEALMMREHLTEMLRTEAVQKQPAEFQQLLERNHKNAQSLETQLAKASGQLSKDSRSRLSATLSAIKTDCVLCHRKYRN